MAELLCESINYPSADGMHTVAGYLYTMPDVPVRAVLQLSHGMCEYIGRYRHMAAFYAAHGIALAGNDHLGHGSTAAEGEHGHFADEGGRDAVLADLHSMNALLHKRYPNLPLFLYGHSMGSFFARWYAEKYPETINALIISGTAGPSVTNKIGYALCCVMAALKGPKHISPMMVKMNFGSYCKRIDNPASPNDWLTRDGEVVKAYDADKHCTFRFTVASYRDMLWVINHVSSKRWAQSLPKALPILIISGAEDPVGNYGEGVRAVYTMLGDAGIEDLTCQIYPDGRHELHNELNKAEVFDYVLTWLEPYIK